MDVVTAIKSRKSIRGYLPREVPRSIIVEIIETALRVPSSKNSQPWEVTVVTGEPLDGIRRDNVTKILSGESGGDFSPKTGVYRQRQIEAGVGLFKLMGIERGDKDKRGEWLLRGYRFFDAPVAIIISASKVLQQTYAVFDVGALTHAICLAALDHGLGTCIEGQGVEFHDVIRKHVPLSEEQVIIAGIALGYPDEGFPANQFISSRALVDEVTYWVGY